LPTTAILTSRKSSLAYLHQKNQKKNPRQYNATHLLINTSATDPCTPLLSLNTVISALSLVAIFCKVSNDFFISSGLRPVGTPLSSTPTWKMLITHEIDDEEKNKDDEN
jgi:hypothetical protein